MASAKSSKAPYWHTHVKHLNNLTGQLASDDDHQRRVDGLLKYAKEQVDKHLAGIRSNLSRLHVKALDLLWPGAGYSSVACGGNFEVLTLLEKQGVLKVCRIMGASGGACSALLALADPNNSSKTLLQCYERFARYKEVSWDQEIMRSSPLWAAIYFDAIKTDEAFQRVCERGYVAVWSGRKGSLAYQNHVLHDYENREQCAMVFQASGEMSASMMMGHRVKGVSDSIGNLCDGGSVTPFLDSQTPLLLYSTFYGYEKSMSGYVTTCTVDSIGVLFKAGVDDTIKLLLSDDLWVGRDQYGNGGMTIVRPDRSQITGRYLGPITEEDCERVYETYGWPELAKDADFFNCRTKEHENDEYTDSECEDSEPKNRFCWN